MSDTEEPVRLAVIGTGLIGQRHAHAIIRQSESRLVATVDPANGAGVFGKVQHFESLTDFLTASDECEGVVIATPNDTHGSIAAACMDAGLPCLIEKPLAANSRDAAAIAGKSESLKIPVLVGHHRRHHAVSAQLKERITSGRLGMIVGAQLTWMLRKPDDYFKAGEWRSKSGGGPIWINLIHEIDLLRYFLGEIVEVSSMLSHSIREAEAEDSGVISMRFADGPIASAMLSDAAPSPWHFEGGSGENPNIAYTGQDGLRIFGTTASLSFPSMTCWSHQTVDEGWSEPIIAAPKEDIAEMGDEAALNTQLRHFCEVVRKNTKPLVNARDGLQSVRVVEAIHQSAIDGKNVAVDLN